MANGSRRHFRLVRLVLLGVLIISACAPATQKQVLYNAKIVAPQEGDTVRGLAVTHYADPDKSYIINDFNTGTAVVPGQKIVIPLIPLRRGGLNAYGYQTVTVLRYKQFSRHPAGPLDLPPHVFESQLALLKREGYHIITIDQLLDFFEFKDQIPHKSVVITIDDNRNTVLDIAFPIIKKHGVPATLFVRTDLIGKKGALTWAEVRYLSRGGIDVQCRSRTYRKRKALQIRKNFNQYIKELDDELLRSKAVMRRELGMDCRYLAYPDRPGNPIVAAFAEKHGFRAGFRPTGDSNPFFVNNFHVGRSTVFGDGDLNKFKQQLKVFETMALK